MQSLYAKPEVAEGIGKFTSARTYNTFQFALSYDNSSRMLNVSFEKPGNVFGVMLAVGIQCDGVGESHLQCLLESAFQGGSFSLVLFVFHKGNACYLS